MTLALSQHVDSHAAFIWVRMPQHLPSLKNPLFLPDLSSPLLCKGEAATVTQTLLPSSYLLRLPEGHPSGQSWIECPPRDVPQREETSNFSSKQSLGKHF